MPFSTSPAIKASCLRAIPDNLTAETGLPVETASEIIETESAVTIKESASAIIPK